jgi:hypothetical protein
MKSDYTPERVRREFSPLQDAADRRPRRDPFSLLIDVLLVVSIIAAIGTFMFYLAH